jgi:hypothetical protein
VNVGALEGTASFGGSATLAAGTGTITGLTGVVLIDGVSQELTNGVFKR